MNNMMIILPLLILFLPLVSFIILIFFGKKLPRQGDWIAVGSIITTFFFAVYLFIQMILTYESGFSHGASFSWIDLDAFKIDLGILVDNLTITVETYTHSFDGITESDMQIKKFSDELYEEINYFKRKNEFNN